MPSIKMCFIVHWFPHGHLGGGSSFRMKKWVNLACLILSWASVVSSLLVLLGSCFLSFKMGCTRKSLWWGFPPYNCYHFFVIICLIFDLMSVPTTADRWSRYGVLPLCRGAVNEFHSTIWQGGSLFALMRDGISKCHRERYTLYLTFLELHFFGNWLF